MMRVDPELFSWGTDGATANLHERVGLGWCAGAGGVGFLEERLLFQGYGRTWTGQGVTRSLSSGGSDHRVQQGGRSGGSIRDWCSQHKRKECESSSLALQQSGWWNLSIRRALDGGGSRAVYEWMDDPTTQCSGLQQWGIILRCCGQHLSGEYGLLLNIWCCD